MTSEADTKGVTWHERQTYQQNIFIVFTLNIFRFINGRAHILEVML